MPGFALDPVTSDRLQRLWHFPYLGVFLGLFLWPLGKIMNKVFGKDQKVLINQGKTDSRISVHQVLYKTPGIQLALVGILNTKRFYPSIRSDKTLKRVFDDLQQGKLPKLKYDSEQHAAAEYMEKLLKGVSAEVSQPFCGTLVCSEGHCIEEMSQFSTLQLPFKKDMCSVATGVQELFECYNTCGDTKAAVTNKKKPPPLNLVFHLRRFDLKKKMGHVKSDCEVELTETIVTQGHVYSLYGVVDHWDSVREGRYTATISENGQWFQYGDNCRQVDAPNGTKSSTAVLILYTQKEPYKTAQDRQRWMGSTESGPHGLINQGATCYLNSVLQVLFRTPEIRMALKHPPLNTTDQALKSLFDKLQDGRCETLSITRDLQAPNVQRCAAEYLEILLNRMSEKVSEPFHGEYLDTTLCSEKHCINKEISEFWNLPLSMDHISSVQEGFERFFKPKKLKGIHCNECKKKGRMITEATSIYEMMKPPQILVLLLKKFGINDKMGYNYTSHREVQIPGTLPLPTKGLVYTLCGVVDHYGGLDGGHYTATIQSQSPEDGHWYNFNDSYVSKVHVPHERSSTAYLLIYRASKQVFDEKDPSGEDSTGRGTSQQNVDPQSMDMDEPNGRGREDQQFDQKAGY